MGSLRLFSTAARFVKRPPWTPPDTLKYPLREIDPAIITPSKWSPPMGGYDHLPFRVRTSRCTADNWFRHALRSDDFKEFLDFWPSTFSRNFVFIMYADKLQVFRSVKGKQVPVYTDYKNGRTLALTIVRKFRGDVEELAKEMSKVCDGRPVSIRPGRIEVKGNYRGRVAEWLMRLGF